MGKTAVLSLVLVTMLAVCSRAQNAPANGTRFNGTIDSVSGNKVVVKTQDSGTISFTLSDDARIVVRKKAVLAQVKQGDFVGCTAVQGPDGKLQAQEIHIFPESMRGAGEGHRPMGGDPNRTMTNATVSGVAPGGRSMTNATVSSLSAAGEATEMKLSYKGGEQNIEVPPSVAVTSMEVVDKSVLQPGMRVAGAADGSDPRTLSVNNLNVDETGASH